MKRILQILALVALGATSGCAAYLSKAPEGTKLAADVAPRTQKTDELRHLPQPKGPISVAVYGFRDQTGQYKQAPDSSFSTAVSQGGAAYLIQALADSGWFAPVEREGLNDLLTERKIIKSGESTPPAGNGNGGLPTLVPANLIIQGSVIGYDFNVATGGIGVKYLGIGASHQFRKDQVTVNLRAIDTSNGRVLHSVSTTKTIYSTLIQPGVYRFVAYKELLEMEAGYTSNEPVQLAIQEAIEAAVISLVVDGIMKKSWVLANPGDIQNPVIQSVYAKLRNRDVAALQKAPAPEVPSFLGSDLDMPMKLPEPKPEPRAAVPAAAPVAIAPRVEPVVAPVPKAASADEAIGAIVRKRKGDASPAAAAQPAARPSRPQDSFVDAGRE
ncbi:CsgG/HfaB family protein [Solimonas sp. K1W22B-7]|uniref:CsgG/HfaB family protein n=1 Tax=Solimonas sp. K1W22B-7 TaxID=2303331 RepID=UPI00196920A4|nr:CsgG/HfaB family protein [Solimonas sp. K1W22B-7]